MCWQSEVRNQMSLIVARIIEDEIRIVSDTKVTNYSAVHNTPLNGSLKCVVVSPSCCVCFAGLAGLAQVAMAPILKSNDLDRASITRHLMREHLAEGCKTDFIVAFADPQPTLVRIIDGMIEEDLPSAWIGDQPAFATYQEHYHTFEQRSKTIFTADEFRWLEIATRMSDAFRAVVEDHKHPSVSDFAITVSSKTAEADGFRYLPSSIGFGFHSVSNTTEETSALRPLGVAGGSYNYSVLTPNRSGIGALGVHFLEGRLGALFYPRIQWEPILFRNTGIDEFINAVSEQFDVSIDGIRHY